MTGDVFTSTLSDLTRGPPLTSRSLRCRRDILAKLYEKPLHRVNLLEGHIGCVNALSWANDGELLLSGGDDTTVRIWKMRQENDGPNQPYPFTCNTEIHTGHTGNIFAALMLPFSSRLVTVSRDKQVRLFDIESASTGGSSATNTGISRHRRIIRCHTDAVKRIVTEASPDSFLTVSEDGSVRQHDLRAPSHICNKSGGCPTPLVKLRHQLFSMSLSPLKPYQFIVAGDSPYGYLFDRRQIGRHLQTEWGMPVDSDNLTTCVRRFARRRKEGREWMDYITGARMNEAGNEVILSYAGDSVYMFATDDDPVEPKSNHSTLIIPPNAKRRKIDDESDSTCSSEDTDPMNVDESTSEKEDQEIEENDPEEEEDPGPQSGIPIILPRLRYSGISNVRTIKDVNFLGPDNKFVVSGSEDGNFFVFRRSTGELHGIYEGDGSVVNVIEGHPHLPLVAVSGIDHTVKLFSPRDGETRWSKIDNATTIMALNSETVSTPRLNVRSLLQTYRTILNSLDEDAEGQCTHQ